ncbi:NUDIX domain-containing protein [Nonomuraea guangzhouensis]|uniref:NUDIX domain-containing protein n=1 Tax=Nonomuraea guangzhouensis TaxID=1291555 RepID=A0ABW4GHV0_9ACTN
MPRCPGEGTPTSKLPLSTPGGEVDAHETPEDATGREPREETGLDQPGPGSPPTIPTSPNTAGLTLPKRSSFWARRAPSVCEPDSSASAKAAKPSSPLLTRKSGRSCRSVP